MYIGVGVCALLDASLLSFNYREEVSDYLHEIYFLPDHPELKDIHTVMQDYKKVCMKGTTESKMNVKQKAGWQWSYVQHIVVLYFIFSSSSWRPAAVTWLPHCSSPWEPSSMRTWTWGSTRWPASGTWCTATRYTLNEVLQWSNSSMFAKRTQKRMQNIYNETIRLHHSKITGCVIFFKRFVVVKGVSLKVGSLALRIMYNGCVHKLTYYNTS